MARLYIKIIKDSQYKKNNIKESEGPIKVQKNRL